MPNTFCKFLSLLVIGCAFSDKSLADWNEMKVCRQWEMVTGNKLDASEQALVIEGSIVSLVDASGQVIGENLWIETNRIRIDPVISSENFNSSGHLFVHEQIVSIASGFTVQDGCARHFIVAVLDQQVRVDDGSKYAVVASVSSIIPLRMMETEEEAHSYIEDIQPTSEEGGSHIECYDPEWMGKGGIQCCGFLRSLREGLHGCSARYFMLIAACVPASLTLGAGLFKWCASHCTYSGPAVAACMKGCLILGGIGSLGAFITCLAGADFAYHECCAEKRAQYWRDLTTSGCRLVDPDKASEGDK